ncbi:cell wall hydrolase [Lachnospiraceae bacterium]|nr:cell wall hydrolase [Lachnospiraceae bacterium]
MKKIFLKNLAVILVLCSLFPMRAEATQQKLDEVQEGIENLKNQKKKAQQQADTLSEEAGGLEGDLAEFNNRLASVTAELNETEQQLKVTRQNLKDTRKALKKARQRESKQYQAMKKRIRFLYEMDRESMLEVLLGAKSFADFLNKAEYFSSIHQYDRNMLEEYRNTKEEIAGKKKELDEHEDALAVLLAQQESKKQEISALINDTSQHLAAAKKQLADAQANVAGYEKKIEQQKAYEAELEAQKAREDAERMEEIRRQEEENKKRQLQSQAQNQNRKPAAVKGDASDTALLAALIQCEAGGESYEGKVAVGSVVMNRVYSSHFPNTVAGVIYQGGQFSPVASGRFASVLASGANASCTQAAQEVLGGNITNNCLYFRRNDGSIPGTIIGNHVFY